MATSPRNLLPLLALVAGIGITSTNIYLPSLPGIAVEFGVPISAVQLTLTVYLFAFAACQLAHGPLSDRFGRRPVLLGGLVITIIGSAACVAATNVAWLIAARVLQAIGACAGVVVTRAVIRDVYRRHEAAAAVSTLGMTLALAPALAPVIGGHLHVWFGWRANFGLIALLGITAWVLLWRWLPETNLQPQRQENVVGSLLGGYRLLLGSAPYWAFVIVVSTVFSGLYGFQAGAPALLIDEMGLSPDDYGLLAAVPTLGFLAGSFVTSRLGRRLPLELLVLTGTVISAAAGLTMLAAAVLGTFTILSVIGPMVVFTIGMGLSLPSALAGGVSLHPQIAGTAAAGIGFLQMLGGSLSTLVVLMLPHTSPLPLAALVAAIGGIGIAGWLLLGPRHGPEPTVP